MTEDRQRIDAGRLAAVARLLLTIFGLVLAGCGSSDAGGYQTASIHPYPGRFVSNGRAVRVEEVRASGRRPHPAVIMLHGASGVGRGWLIYPYADAITRRGIDVFIVHYFDGLGDIGNPSGTAYFEARNHIIRDAIGYVDSLPGTDGRRIGMFGLSLGGFHAVGLSTRDHRIAAVVDMMGALPRSVPRRSVRSMPPTLILHGARDDVVPIERAADLALLLGRVGAPFEMKVYRDGGHSMSGAAHRNSIRLTADFFDRYLNGRVPRPR